VFAAQGTTFYWRARRGSLVFRLWTVDSSCHHAVVGSPNSNVQIRMTFSSDESMLHRCGCSWIWKTSLHLTYIPTKTSVSWIWSCCVAKHHGRANPWWIPDLDSLFPVVNLYQIGPIFWNWDDIKNGHYIYSFFCSIGCIKTLKPLRLYIWKDIKSVGKTQAGPTNCTSIS